MQYRSANVFLDALFGPDSQKHARIRDIRSQIQKSSTQLILLVPQAICFLQNERDSGQPWASLMTDDFIASHIIRVPYPISKADPKKPRQYVCQNGQTVIMRDGLIYPHKGFKNVHQVRLLNDRLFYFAGSTILMYYIDRPLLGSVQTDERRHSSAGSIHFRSLSDLGISGSNNGSEMLKVSSFSDILRLFPGISKTVEPDLKETLKAFNERQVAAGGEIDLERLSLEIEAVLNEAVDIFVRIKDTEKHALVKHTGLTGAVVTELIEAYVMQNLYDLVFYKFSAFYRSQDANLDSAIHSAQAINAKQIGLPHDLPDLDVRLEQGVTHLRELVSERTPRGKLDKLVALMQAVAQSNQASTPTHQNGNDLVPSMSNGNSGITECPKQISRPLSLGGDFVIPMLLFLLVRAGVTNVYSNIAYMRLAHVDLESGEYGYALSSLEAVATYIVQNKSRLQAISDENLYFNSLIMEGSAQDVDEYFAKATARSSDNDDMADTPDRIRGVILGQDRTHISPFMRCVKQADIEKVVALLKSQYVTQMGILEDRDESGRTLVLNAVILSRADIVIKILRYLKGTSISIIRKYLASRDKDNRHAAHYMHLTPMLMQSIGHLMNWTDKDRSGLTPFMTLCRMYDHPHYREMILFVIKLLPKPIDLQQHCDDRKNTPLHIVTDVTCINALLETCTNPNVPNSKGMYPLHVHTKFSRLDVVKVMLDFDGVDFLALDSSGLSALHTATHSSAALVEVLLQKIPPAVRGLHSGANPLHYACRERAIHIVSLLLEYGADPSWQDYSGMTAYAYSAGDNDILRLLDQNLLRRVSMNEDHKTIVINRTEITSNFEVVFNLVFDIKLPYESVILRGIVQRSMTEFSDLYQLMKDQLWSPNFSIVLAHPCSIPAFPSTSVRRRMSEITESFLVSCSHNPRNSGIIALFLDSRVDCFTGRLYTDSQESKAESGAANGTVQEIGPLDTESLNGLNAFFQQISSNITLLQEHYGRLKQALEQVLQQEEELPVAYKALHGEMTINQRSELWSPGRNFDDLGNKPAIPRREAVLHRAMRLNPLLPSAKTALYTRVLSVLADLQGLQSALVQPQKLQEEISHLTSELLRYENRIRQHDRWSGPLGGLMPEGGAKSTAATAVASSLAYLTDAASSRLHAVSGSGTGTTEQMISRTQTDIAHRAQRLMSVQTQLANELAQFQEQHARTQKSHLLSFVRNSLATERQRLRELEQTIHK